MKNRAFTLIELLVVVLIIGILTAIALPQYTKAVAKARMTEALTIHATLSRAIELYGLSHPPYDGELQIFFGTNGINLLDVDIPHVSCLEGESCQTKNISFSASWGETNGGGLYYGFIKIEDLEQNFLLASDYYPTIRQWKRYCYWETALGKSLCEGLADWTVEKW